MSTPFNFAHIKPKTDLVNPVTAHTAPTPNVEEAYNFRKQRIQQQLQKRLETTKDLPFSVRVGFLTADDKAALCTGITNLGYTCTEVNGLLTIQ